MVSQPSGAIHEIIFTQARRQALMGTILHHYHKLLTYEPPGVRREKEEGRGERRERKERGMLTWSNYGLSMKKCLGAPSN